MRTIRDEGMENQTIQIDDKSFVGCTLTNCILEYSGGPVNFDQTVFRGCRYVFFGPARGAVHFLQAVGLLGTDPSLWGEFPSVLH